MDKLCAICKVNTSVKNSNGTNKAYCKECRNLKARLNWSKRGKEVKSESNRKIDVVINDRKKAPCADCGVIYPPYITDFDHVNHETKLMNISRMRSKHMAIGKIIEEMDKCDVVCANCHRERTNKRNPARYAR